MTFFTVETATSKMVDAFSALVGFLIEFTD